MSRAFKAHPSRIAEREAVFEALKGLLVKHASKLRLVEDVPGKYRLDTRSASWRGRTMLVASTQIRKTYVSYYLMPVYLHPEMAGGISHELRRHMHGKCCFNFRRPEPSLFSELGRLTDAGIRRYEREKLL